MDGLIHLYELDQSINKLNLVSRLHLPQSKHRWLTSYSIIVSKIQSREILYLTGGDKCGNLYFYIIEMTDNQSKANLIHPIQSIKSVTKENSSISAIYSKCCLKNDLGDYFNYLLICCSKDGFYRIFEFNSESLADYDSEETKEILRLVNKCQINSYVEIIESMLFDETSVENEIAEKGFNLENDLKMAFCFYGDKFLLWNFHLNRALFEFKCGGSHRSWDYEFCARENGDALFRFVCIKNKSIVETRKLLARNEMEKSITQKKTSLCQVFHGNMITTCKYLIWENYVLTGSEDTQLILTEISTSSQLDLILDHQFHLQGHDSAVKCLGYCKINESELLLVSAGGKANIKIWKVSFNADLKKISKIVYLYEFKRLIRKKLNANEKPWLYVDIKSNPEIRFMDVAIFKSETECNFKDFICCFACSDGFVRIFRYDLEENKLFLLNKYEYSKCLFCIKRLKVIEENNLVSYLVCFGTDGKLLKWRLNLEENSKTFSEFEKIDLHQSGINGVDVWEDLPNSGRYSIATVGDDARISVIEFDLNTRKESAENIKIIKLDMAHASNVVDCKFLKKDVFSSVSKDQRMIIWKIDYELKEVYLHFIYFCIIFNQFNALKIMPLNVIFTNIADASSMSVIKLK